MRREIEFGDRRVDQIETSDVLKVLSPIWLTKPETARRVRQRMRTVFDWGAEPSSSVRCWANTSPRSDSYGSTPRTR